MTDSVNDIISFKTMSPGFDVIAVRARYELCDSFALPVSKMQVKVQFCAKGFLYFVVECQISIDEPLFVPRFLKPGHQSRQYPAGEREAYLLEVLETGFKAIESSSPVQFQIQLLPPNMLYEDLTVDGDRFLLPLPLCDYSFGKHCEWQLVSPDTAVLEVYLETPRVHLRKDRCSIPSSEYN